jgi:Zn-dependent peptidase ImmA (M78 family)
MMPMLYDGEYRVYLVPFPGDIKAAVRLDEEGFPSIYINENLSQNARKAAFLHELRHIRRNDHTNEKTINEIEK